LGLCQVPGICIGNGCNIIDPFAACPTDNPCNVRFCNPFTGQCEDTGISPCSPCDACQPVSTPRGFGPGPLPFECIPLPDGASCDDFNDCTGDGTCENGNCLGGAPIDGTPVQTPEPTATAPAPSPTPMPTNTLPPPSPTATEPVPTNPVPAPTPTATEPLPTPIPTNTPTTPLPTPTSPPGAEFDFGDAPDGIGDPSIPTPGYPTLLTNDGARHIIVEGFFLGGSVDRDPDGQPNVTATGDDDDSVPDDEDGVEFLTLVRAGDTVRITVTASALGRLDAFVDFNRNGSWADAGEQVFADTQLQPGPNQLGFNVPASAAGGLSFARFRYSTAGGLSSTGLANDGEVEDYLIDILGASTIATRLTAAIDEATNVIPVEDATGFPPSGVVRIDEELIRYSSIVPTGTTAAGGRIPRGGAVAASLIVDERGTDGTTPSSHDAGALVVVVPETPACVGDCGNDGQVTVDELIVGVNIALGETSIDACLAFDAGGDGQVTVDEILLAVNNALDGCPV
jgi:hypothetical protein